MLISVFVIWWAIIYFFPGHTIATGFNGGFGSFRGLILRIALQVTILVTGYLVLRIFPNKELWFTKYGTRTMNVYLLHAIIVLPFAFQVFPPFAEANWWLRILMIIVPTTLCIPLFSKRVDKLMRTLLGVIK